MALCVLLVAAVGCRAQNGNDSVDGSATAAFTQTTTMGQPGLVVQFTDTSSGNITAYSWDLGDGMVSSDPNPVVTYNNPGSFDVSLTVTGDTGTSTETKVGLVQIAGPPTAGFTCTPEAEFAPATIDCMSTATGATVINWSFSDGSNTVLASGSNPSVTLASPGTYTVTQSVGSPGGNDVANSTIFVFPFTLTATPPSGSPPGLVMLSADTGSPPPLLVQWSVDGQPVGMSPNSTALLRTPGTYTIEYFFSSVAPPLTRTESFQYEVTYGPPTAGFTPDEAVGSGPRDVVFADESLGEITQWDWDFGDGISCVFPAPVGAPPGSPGVCDSASPTHTYDDVGHFDVTLTVTGAAANPADPELVDTIVVADAVTVTILDPSFEDQGVAMDIASPWTPLRPAGAAAVADHTTLATSQPGGADGEMPTDGTQWAALDGLGTDGSSPVETIENGIRQDFVVSDLATVIEFDYVFLHSEPPAAGVLDAMTATVSDGGTVVEMTSARADAMTAYLGGSMRYPTLDGSTTRATPLHTASLDLAQAFPAATPDTVFTLTIRLTNAANSFRSPRAYVDHIRFVEPAAPFVASFSAPAVIVEGESVDFADETCLDPVGTGCVVPTSWRWDFDTGLLPTLPAATGSGEQNPMYIFESPGDFDVTLVARNADQESTAVMSLTVLEAPVANIVLVSQDSASAPANFTFSEASTSGAGDPIVSYEWDFGGWGSSTSQNPAPVAIGQSGTWTIRLTVETASGLRNTGVLDVILN